MWSDECEVAFARIKELLTSPPLLQSPRPGEELFLYLGVGEASVSAVLVREEGGKQWPTYYVSRVLDGAEERYPLMEKLTLALIVTTRQLRPYFQAHSTTVVTDRPLKSVLAKPEHSGRLLKWSVELGEFDISFVPRTAIKAQALADFMADFGPEGKADSLIPEETWELFTDGSSGVTTKGAGVMHRSPGELTLNQSIELDFPVTNNQAEYEALLAGLRFALQLEVKHLRIFSDSQLLVRQVNGEYEVRDDTLKKYVELARAEIVKFSQHGLIQIPRGENSLADALSRPSATRTRDFVLQRPSFDSEVMSLTEGPNGWMNPFYTYLGGDTRNKNLRNKAAYYFMIGDTLYRRSTTGINL